MVSLAIVWWLFPRTHPYGGMRLTLTADSILAHSRLLLNNLGVDYAGMSESVQLKVNSDLASEIQRRYGLEASNAMIRDSIPAYYWEVRWKKQRSRKISSGSGSDDSKAAEEVVSVLRGDIRVDRDTRGRLLDFEQGIEDSARLVSLPQPAAKELAYKFLRTYIVGPRSMGDTAACQSERAISQPYRVDHEFVWTVEGSLPGTVAKAKAVVAGNRIKSASIEENVPNAKDEGKSRDIFEIVIVVIYVIIGIAMVVVAFRRFRSYEIGFRLAIIAGVLTAVLFGIETFLSVPDNLGWELLITLGVVPIFIGGAVLLFWAVSEAVVRETWKEKFISFDLIAKGHFAHPKIGEGIIRGIAAGSASLAVSLILTHLADRALHLSVSQSGDVSLHTFDLAVPSLYVLAHAAYVNVFSFTFSILFVVSLLRKFIAPSWLLVVAGSVVMGVLNFGHLDPIAVSIVVQVFAAGVSVWAFCRFDGLTAFLSMFTFSVLQETAGLLSVNNALLAFSGSSLVVLMGAGVVLGVWMLYRKSSVVDYDDIAPAFARHITERQRLQQELEIARSVQMSFLPKTNPVTSKLDIASRCAPALEVGGDYFDFIDLGKKRLGVAVGDVSGKGTQAAFFMTLTKGFLTALARVSASPSEILTQVNRLFYENVERGIFISMVYGIFDTAKNTLTLARAGHNPVIMQKSGAKDVQVVNPTGLALGLDEGTTFSKSIKEVTIRFKPGDLFVFYTDGFPEAMNKSMEEFGEERLCKTVEKYSRGSASEIMENIFNDMKQFTGKTKQHDDMTIVVVKIPGDETRKRTASTERRVSK
ncbi:MAG TPA: PP2C family protein-serine/threonine phosphatase [Bacteroidota bacterium]